MLRKVMIEKFPQFDEYQLAKYNRPKKNKNKDISKKPTDSADSDPDDLIIEIDELFKEPVSEEKAATLKRFVRLLHINKPVKFVMGLLGKRYPQNEELFRCSGLPGNFVPDLVGFRMKLVTPLTWETELSDKGNKAEVWQNLLDKKKLPYMAMLRNLRNIILAKISTSHHDLVIKLLSNEKSVVNSRQFPLAFYSAFEAVTLVEHLVTKLEEGTLKPSKEFRPDLNTNLKMKIIKKKYKNVDTQLTERYKNALDKAMQIAVYKNLDPIPGRSLVICDLHSTVVRQFPPLKGGLKLCNQTLLLGLMCLSACETCELVLSGRSTPIDGLPASETLMQRLTNLRSQMRDYFTEGDFTEQLENLFEELLEVQNVHKQPFNNIILLTNGKNFSSDNVITQFLIKYRNLLNPKLLYIRVDVAGSKSPDLSENPLNVNLSGTSDQLLKFLATQGTTAQVNHVENIDTIYDLKPLPKGLQQELAKQFVDNCERNLTPKIVPPLEWRTIRVFISSTFRDMHGERDLLVRYVFPELRSRAKDLLVNVHEVDLRWGVTEEESSTQGSLDLCLTEVSRCHYFLGILGERYGTVPSLETLPNEPQYDWVRDYAPGSSITELEMFSAALNDPEKAKEKAFFYFRNNSFESEIPKKWKNDFLSESAEDAVKITSLKNRIRNSGLEVFDGYPGCWGGEVNNTPVIFGLEDFGQRVLDNMWNVIQKRFNNKAEPEDEMIIVSEPNDLEIFGRQAQIDKCLSYSWDNVLVITGKPGSGKTAFMKHLSNQFPAISTVSCFIGAEYNCNSLSDVLIYICNEICSKFGLLVAVPNETQNLAGVLWNSLFEGVKRSPTNDVTILIDGLDQLPNIDDQKPDWFPNKINGVKIVLSVTEFSATHQFLTNQNKIANNFTFWSLESLGVAHRKEVVSSTLSKYRKSLSVDAFNNQMLRLVTKKDSVLPGFLKLACEELRVFGNFEQLSLKIASLPDTLPKLLEGIICQLEKQHGKELVETALLALSLCQDGLEEKELLVILSLSQLLPTKKESELLEIVQILISMQPEQLIPATRFAAFCRNLRNTLQSKSGKNAKILLGQTEVGKAIRNRYLNSISKQKEIVVHKLIAAYFLSTSNPGLDTHWQVKTARAISCLPQHLIGGQCFVVFCSHVCSLQFLAAIFRISAAPILIEAMQSFLFQFYTDKNIQWKFSKSEVSIDKVNDYLNFVRKYLHENQMTSLVLIQQALCEPDNSEVYLDAEKELPNVPFALFRWWTKPAENSPCKLTFNLPVDVLCCVSSPDTKYLALGGADGTVRLYCAKIGKLIRNFTGHSQSVCTCLFVDEKTLCSCSVDGTICLWDVEGGFRKNILTGHTKRVTGVCVDLTKLNLISTSWDQSIRLWSLRDGRQISVLQNKGRINCVAQHPSKHLIVIGDWQKTLKLWDMEDLKRKAVFTGHTSSVQCVLFNSNGLHVVSGSANGEIMIWFTISGALLAKPNSLGISINNIRYASDEHNLISTGFDGKLTVWADHNKNFIWSRKPAISKLNVLLFLTVDFVAFGYEDGTVRVCKTTDGQQILRVQLDEPVIEIRVVYSNLLTLIVATKNGNVIKIVQTKGSDPKKNITTTHLGSVPGEISCLHSYKKWAFVGCKNGLVGVCSIYVHNGFDTCLEHTSEVTCLSTIEAPTEEGGNPFWLLSGSCDKSVKVWTVNDLNQLLYQSDDSPANLSDDWITSMSCNGVTVVTGSRDTTVSVWDVDTYELRVQLKGLGEPIKKVYLVREEFVVASGVSGKIAIWKINGDLMGIFESTLGTKNAFCDFYLQFCFEAEKPPLKGFFVFQDDSNNIRMSRLFGFEPVSQLDGHTAPITSLACLGANSFVSLSLDSSLRWWDTTDVIDQSKGLLRSKIIATEFSKNGEMTLSCDNSSVKLWAFKNQEETVKLEKRTCVVAGDLKLNKACITAIAFVSETGDKIICGIHKKKYSVCLYKPDDSLELKLISELKVTSEVTNVAWSPETDLVHCCQKNGSISLYDSNLEPVSNLPIEVNWLLYAKPLSTDRYNYLVAVSDGSVYYKKLRSIAQVTSYEAIPVDIHSTKAWLSAIAHTDQSVVIGDSDGIISGKKNNSSFKVRAHSEIITGIALGLNDKYIFSASKDKTVKVWNFKTLKQVSQFTFSMPITCLSVSPVIMGENGEGNASVLVLVGTESGTTHLIEWDEGKSN